MGYHTMNKPARNDLGRSITLPWWRWWGRGEVSTPPVAPRDNAKAISRFVVSVENGWHSELQDVPAFIQSFVMALNAQEDSHVIPTVEFWEIYMDGEDATLSEPFRQLLNGESSDWNGEPAFQTVLLTTRDGEAKHQSEESIAFFRVTGQGTRCFVGHVPNTHAWLWGCSLWAAVEEQPAAEEK